MWIWTRRKEIWFGDEHRFVARNSHNLIIYYS